jgi:BASS family bile acid:Na+ symporter
VDIAVVLKLAPALLALMMLGMGMGLVPADFSRLLHAKRPVLTGLFGQMVALPLLGFGIASLAPVGPEVACGLAILSAAPGGPGSNLVALLSRADVALSVSLTAANSLLAVLTVPVLVGLATRLFLGEAHVPPPTSLAGLGIGVFLLTVLPVSAGMAVKHWRPSWAARADRPVRVGSLLLLLLLVVGVAIEEWEQLPTLLAQAGLVDVVLCGLGMATGYGLAVLAGLDGPQRRTLLIEVGVQNGALALLVTDVLGRTALAVPVLVYSPVMLGASLVVVFASRGIPVEGTD